jgi:UDPglucose 6-dehydrogenase
MREAPSRVVIDSLVALGAAICAYDPVAIDEAKRLLGDAPGVTFAANPLAACEGADALVVVTEWKEFRSPDFDEMKRRMKRALIFDGRNLYEPDIVRGAGFEHVSIGRR